MLDHLTMDFKLKTQYNLEVKIIITDREFNPETWHSLPDFTLTTEEARM